MTIQQIIEEIRETELNSNSTRFSNDYLLKGINIDDAELVMMYLNASPDHNFKIEEAYTTLKSSVGLVAGDTGYNGEYSFPSDLIKPLRAEISHDGVTWREATVYDITSSTANSEQNQTQIQDEFTENRPYVRFERDSYFVRPLKTSSGDITNGIHIWYEKRQEDTVIGDIATATPSIEPNFHRLYVLRGALRGMRKFRNDYSIQDRSELKKEIEKLEDQFKKFAKERFKRPLRIAGKQENFA